MKRKDSAMSLTGMTAADLAKHTAEFDQEFVADTFKPLTAVERTRWERVRQKRSGLEANSDTPEVSVRLDRDLLARSDALAEKLGITRDCLIARGLKAVLAAAGESE